MSSPSGPLPTGIWQRDNGGSALYDYDPLYRLISATYSSGEVYTYTYDAVGNRLAMGADGELITYTYDIANRLTWVEVLASIFYLWFENTQIVGSVGSPLLFWSSMLVSLALQIANGYRIALATGISA